LTNFYFKLKEYGIEVNDDNFLMNENYFKIV